MESSRLSSGERPITVRTVVANLEPSNLAELCQALSRANAKSERIEGLNLRAMNRVLEHVPEDMTVTVEAGITLAELQARLKPARQWLPLDPPHPERKSIGAILATNASGPRRFGFGTSRDYVIGLRVALADGTVIKTGGKVVKNVAGYDLAKLFIGSQGTLGIIVEATFKLRPIPEREAFVQAVFPTLDEALALTEGITEPRLNPTVWDAHNSDSSTLAGAKVFTVVLGFAGTREDVEIALTRVSELGVTAPASLDYENRFWSAPELEPPKRATTLPSRFGEALRRLGDVPFLARAGNGVIYYRGGPSVPTESLPRHLFQRVKDAYDPNHVFPGLTA